MGEESVDEVCAGRKIKELGTCFMVASRLTYSLNLCRALSFSVGWVSLKFGTTSVTLTTIQ
jgi:hypothetical protein